MRAHHCSFEYDSVAERFCPVIFLLDCLSLNISISMFRRSPRSVKKGFILFENEITWPLNLCMNVRSKAKLNGTEIRTIYTVSQRIIISILLLLFIDLWMGNKKCIKCVTKNTKNRMVHDSSWNVQNNAESSRIELSRLNACVIIIISFETSL